MDILPRLFLLWRADDADAKFFTLSDSYHGAHKGWKKLKPLPIDASRRMTREQAHERR
ncbi:MAG TPA: hypothetical protein VK419_15475 [Bryobacteraceae bacterium]|nr:hypothetical protein [Bryobacteraceae bacterium]